MIKELKKLVQDKHPKSLHFHLKKLDKNKLIELTSFLSDDVTIGRRVYHIINELQEIPQCPYCKNHKKWADAREYSLCGYINTCEENQCKEKYHKEFNLPSINVKRIYGVNNYSQTNEWKEKVKETNLRTKGVEWNTQSNELIEARRKSWKENKDEQLTKRIETNKERYNCEHGLQNKEVRKKIMKTWLNNYNETHPNKVAENINKIKETHEKLYGGWYITTDEGKEKSKQTLFKNYGVLHNSQSEEVIKKRFQRKPYALPSGKIIKVQGYEDRALDILFESYNEQDIITDPTEMKNFIGKIKYIGTDNKEHRYFPDIYIKSEHKVIEVKSTYTYKADKETNELKKQSCINAGINFEFMIL